MSSKDEEDDDHYEHIGNDKCVKSNKNNISNVFIKSENCSSILTTKDKKVSCLKTISKKMLVLIFLYNKKNI